jgi:hypothetical protein
MLTSFFETKKAREEKAHLRNLITLANSDGELSNTEIEVIYQIGLARGLKDFEIADLIHENTVQTEVELPANDQERFDQIFEIVQVMLADGKVTDEEIDFCISYAEKIGFSKAFAGVVVNKIAIGISNEMSKNAIQREMESFLAF